MTRSKIKTASITDDAVTTAKVNPAQTDITSVGTLSSLAVSGDLTAATSSGNFMVGKTALNGNTVGLQVKPAGELGVVRDANHSLILNRKSSDGNIALFQKDGSTVGSVSYSNATNIALNNGSSKGIGIGTSAIFPTN